MGIVISDAMKDDSQPTLVSVLTGKAPTAAEKIPVSTIQNEKPLIEKNAVAA